MPKVTRRQTIGALAGAGSLPGAAALTAAATPAPGIRFAELFTPGDARKLKLARQVGVNHAIVGVGGALAKVRREQYADELLKICDEFGAAGMKIAGVESHPVAAEKIKLGVDGRDEEIENYKWAIAALAKVGIPMVCYNFMAGLGWYRTRVNVPERGGALVSEFVLTDAEAKGPTEFGTVSEERMWSNIEYFLKAVMPVAEKHGVQMALHPDDPPLSPLRGIARIITSARNYRRIMDMVPSPVNGVTYCQANFVLMGEDVEALARRWCREKEGCSSSISATWPATSAASTRLSTTTGPPTWSACCRPTASAASTAPCAPTMLLRSTTKTTTIPVMP